jgi:hypothetical protein
MIRDGRFQVTALRWRVKLGGPTLSPGPLMLRKEPGGAPLAPQREPAGERTGGASGGGHGGRARSGCEKSG